MAVRQVLRTHPLGSEEVDHSFQAWHAGKGLCTICIKYIRCIIIIMTKKRSMSAENIQLLNIELKGSKLPKQNVKQNDYKAEGEMEQGRNKKWPIPKN